MIGRNRETTMALVLPLATQLQPDRILIARLAESRQCQSLGEVRAGPGEASERRERIDLAIR